jgi:hypothetical protein
MLHGIDDFDQRDAFAILYGYCGACTILLIVLCFRAKEALIGKPPHQRELNFSQGRPALNARLCDSKVTLTFDKAKRCEVEISAVRIQALWRGYRTRSILAVAARQQLSMFAALALLKARAQSRFDPDGAPETVCRRGPALSLSRPESLKGNLDFKLETALLGAGTNISDV